MLTIAVVLFAVQIAVLSTPVAQGHNRIDIPLTRRDARAADVVDTQVLKNAVTAAIL